MSSEQELCFGDKDRSDAVLVTGNTTFLVHKEFLATRSSYFRDFFFSEEWPDYPIYRLDEIHPLVLEANLRVLYEHHIKESITRCPTVHTFKDESAASPKDNFDFKGAWNFYEETMNVASHFGCTDLVRTAISSDLSKLTCYNPKCCVACFSFLHYRTQDFMVTGVRPMMKALRELASCVSIFCIQPGTLGSIFNTIIQGETEVRLRDTSDMKPLPPMFDYPNSKIMSFTYGDPATVNATLTIGSSRFHVNKLALAAQSLYFQSSFLGSFSEEFPENLTIPNTDDVAFKHLMDLIHYGKIDNEEEIFGCGEKDRIQKSWEEMIGILGTISQFGFLPLVRSSLESRICVLSCRKSDCINCASSVVMSMHFGLEEVKDKLAVSPDAICKFLLKYSEYLPVLHIKTTEFYKLVEELIK